MYLRAGEILENTSGPKDPTMAHIYNNRASLLRALVRFSGRERKMPELIFYRGGENGALVRVIKKCLCYAAPHRYMLQAKYVDAGALFRKAYEICVEAYGSEAPNTAAVLNNWAELLRLQVSAGHDIYI